MFSTECQVCAKESMDRFDDRLTEEMLQYLTFEDKVRLECVSKQWRRLVFNKQFGIELEFNYSEEKQNSENKPFNRMRVKEQYLESVLKKCPNIRKVILSTTDINSKLLSLIGQYCHQIRSLTLNSSGINDLDFFRMYGHKLEELSLTQCLNNEKIKHILKLSPNLRKVGVKDSSVLLKKEQEYLPNLEHMSKIWDYLL